VHAVSTVSVEQKKNPPLKAAAEVANPTAQTITFAVHDLCKNPEYREPLRQELIDGYSGFEATGVGLPLLDSFIKESARLSPIESRKRLLPLPVHSFCPTYTKPPGRPPPP
jgi:hypothetical protein